MKICKSLNLCALLALNFVVSLSSSVQASETNSSSSISTNPYAFINQATSFGGDVSDAAVGRNSDMIFQGVGVAANLNRAFGVHMPRCFTAKPNPVHCAQFGLALAQTAQTGQAMLRSLSDRDRLSPEGTNWSTPEFNQFLNDNQNSFSQSELADLQTLGDAYKSGDAEDINKALSKLTSKSNNSLTKLEAKGYKVDLDNQKVYGPGLDPKGTKFSDINTADSDGGSKSSSSLQAFEKLNQSLQAGLDGKKYKVDPKKAALLKAKNLITAEKDSSSTSLASSSSSGAGKASLLKVKSYNFSNPKDDNKTYNGFNQDPALKSKLSGMSRKITDGSSIGVARDNIFSIVKDRYSVKEKDSNFIPK